MPDLDMRMIDSMKGIIKKSSRFYALLDFFDDKLLAESNTTPLRSFKKVSGNAYTISVRESEGVAVTVQTEELSGLYHHTKTTVEPDEAVIKESLKSGLTIPGCALVKTYSLQGR